MLHRGEGRIRSELTFLPPLAGEVASEANGGRAGFRRLRGVPAASPVPTLPRKRGRKHAYPRPVSFLVASGSAA